MKTRLHFLSSSLTYYRFVVKLYQYNESVCLKSTLWDLKNQRYHNSGTRLFSSLYISDCRK